MTSKEACTNYKWLVEAIAEKFRRPGLEIEDLVQEGYLGLLKAVDEWEAGRGASFETIANARIRDALRMFTRSMRSGVSLDAAATDEDGTILDSPSVRMLGIEGMVTAPDQEEATERVERIASVRRAMDAVSADDRQLLQTWADVAPDGSRRNEGAVPEIARRMGLPRTTVDFRCRSAKKRLGEEIRKAS